MLLNKNSTITRLRVTKKLHTTVYLNSIHLSAARGKLMSQVIKLKSTPETKAGQYMCRECGEIFNDKKSVDSHQKIVHNPHYRSTRGNLPTQIYDFSTHF
jgi:hypothetical protein